jgi:hypothetical protein
MSNDNKIGGGGGENASIPLPGTTEKVHLKDMPVGTKCDIHEWPSAGLAARLLQAMRARHRTGGINACATCITRAREDAKKHATTK